MVHLRPRQRPVFSGFTNTEIEKMEKLLRESREKLLDQEFCKKLARNFNCSKGRAGKPIVKWNEVQRWIENRQQDLSKDNLSKDNPRDACNKLTDVQHQSPSRKGNENSEMSKGEKVPCLSELEFEARSSKDGAWYDVDTFLAHRFLSSAEPEVLVRFVGFGEEEDEWVNVKKSVREQSIPLEHSECHKVKDGDLVLCFQERRDQARYYDAHILEIRRRLHDIRGCRCLFFIRYDHDDTEETVRLRRLCYRPTC